MGCAFGGARLGGAGSVLSSNRNETEMNRKRTPYALLDFKSNENEMIKGKPGFDSNQKEQK
jgi:hypothetical protein